MKIAVEIKTENNDDIGDKMVKKIIYFGFLVFCSTCAIALLFSAFYTWISAVK